MYALNAAHNGVLKVICKKRNTGTIALEKKIRLKKADPHNAALEFICKKRKAIMSLEADDITVLKKPDACSVAIRK